MKTYLIYPLFISLFIAMLFTCGTEPEDRSIHGFVYDSANSEPVPGVEVTAGGLTDSTSFEGYFNLGTLPSGQYELYTDRVCYEDHMQTIDVKDEITEITINLSLEELPVSRIYDVKAIDGFTLDFFREDPEEYLDWPEVIELDNESNIFTGRVKCGKNGWASIVPVWEYDEYYHPRVYYPIPVSGFIRIGVLYRSEYLIFAGVINRTTDEQITGWVGDIHATWDYTVPFLAVYRQSKKH